MFNLSNIDKIKNGKKLITFLLYIYGYSYIFKIIEQFFDNKKYNIIINFSNYFPFITNSIKLSNVDYYIMIILVKILPTKTKQIYIVKDELDFDNLIDLFKQIKTNYIIIIHKKTDIDSTNFDHVSVYNNTNNYFYNILDQDSKIYISNSSCAINCLCYILDCLNISFNNSSIITLFKFFQLYPKFVFHIYFKIFKNYNLFATYDIAHTH